MKTRALILAVLIFWMASLSGCAWWDKTKEKIWGKEQPARTAEALYSRGYEQYKKGEYKKAVETFTRVRDEYPLSPVALMAELGIGDSYYENQQYLDAEVGYSSFIELHPTSPQLPYAMYQLAMCHYSSMQSLDRDQTETQKARREFERLLTRFPQSKFAIMAEKHLIEVKQRIAEHEFYVGEFYYRTKRYNAALKRFETVQRDYPNLGLDYKTAKFIQETKEMIRKEDALKAPKTDGAVTQIPVAP